MPYGGTIDIGGVIRGASATTFRRRTVDADGEVSTNGVILRTIGMSRLIVHVIQNTGLAPINVTVEALYDADNVDVVTIPIGAIGTPLYRDLPWVARAARLSFFNPGADPANVFYMLGANGS